MPDWLVSTNIITVELNQNHIRACLYPGELLLDILHDPPDGLLAESLHLGEGSLVLGLQPLPLAVPSSPLDQAIGCTLKGSGQEMSNSIHFGRLTG